ncbi:MAG: hypothetical protein K2N48_12620 [Muribaculaceae bacterium]|nr:hypothetical protein [Muribaculaceae bacterium]
MKPTIMQLKELALVGGNIILSTNDYPLNQIRELIVVGKSRGVSVTIRNADKLTSLQRKSIAFLNPTKVTFDFS